MSEGEGGKNEDKDDEMNNKENKDILLAQYDAVSNQIIHWDTFFWKKSTVFFAFESAAFFGVVKVVIDTIAKDDSKFGVGMLFIHVATISLCLYMCVVWLRTGIRNREFLNIRFVMGRTIENYFKLPTLTLYNYQYWQTYKHGGMKSYPFEVAMPMVFEVVWILVLCYLLNFSLNQINFKVCSLELAGFLLIVVFCVIGFVYLCFESRSCIPQIWKAQDQRGIDIPDNSVKEWDEFSKHITNKWGA